MTPEEAKGYGIIDEIISSRSAAEEHPTLLQGEPQRIAESQDDASPAEKPEA